MVACIVKLLLRYSMYAINTPRLEGQTVTKLFQLVCQPLEKEHTHPLNRPLPGLRQTNRFSSYRTILPRAVVRLWRCVQIVKVGPAHRDLVKSIRQAQAYLNMFSIITIQSQYTPLGNRLNVTFPNTFKRIIPVSGFLVEEPIKPMIHAEKYKSYTGEAHTNLIVLVKVYLMFNRTFDKKKAFGMSLIY